MTNKWLKTIEIKQHLRGGTSRASVKRARAGVFGEIRKEYEPGKDRVLDEIVLELEAANTAPKFNTALGKLYEWADDSRVWMGL